MKQQTPWTRARAIFRANVAPGANLSRGKMISLLRRRHVPNCEKSWVDQLLYSMVSGGELTRTGKRGSMVYSGVAPKSIVGRAIHKARQAKANGRAAAIVEALSAKRVPQIDVTSEGRLRVTLADLTIEIGVAR